MGSGRLGGKRSWVQIPLARLHFRWGVPVLKLVLSIEQIGEIVRSVARAEQRVRELDDGALIDEVDAQELIDMIEQVAKERFPEEYAAKWPGR
jgi:hypothetical protein